MSGIGVPGITSGTGTGQITLSSGTVTVGTNNDKTGYSLTAGSYVLHASNNQRGTVTMSGVSTNTATISSVTTTRSRLAYLGDYNDQNNTSFAMSILALTNATTITATRGAATGAVTTSYEVEETF